jgi:hypothetical protein
VQAFKNAYTFQRDSSSFVSGRAPLSDIASAIVLCWTAHYVSNSENSELTDEELAAYIDRVKLHPGNWLVFSTCLLLQTRVESRRSKTAGRSVFQLEVLIAEYTTAQAGELERLRWLHALPWPVRWELRAEMAQRYSSLPPQHRTAFQFEELHFSLKNCISV